MTNTTPLVRIGQGDYERTITEEDILRRYHQRRAARPLRQRVCDFVHEQGVALAARFSWWRCFVNHRTSEIDVFFSLRDPGEREGWERVGDSLTRAGARDAARVAIWWQQITTTPLMGELKRAARELDARQVAEAGAA